MAKYEEVMEHIQLTDAAKERILNHIDSELSKDDKPQKIMRPLYKKILSVAACFVVLLAGAALLPQLMQKNTIIPSDSEALTFPGITELTTAEALAADTGLPVQDIPVLKEQAVQTGYYSYGDLAEIQYQLPDGTVTYRVSAGEQDNSGDYNDYEQVRQVDISGCTVTLKGAAERISLATWSRTGYAYSLGFADAVTESEAVSLLESTIE